MGTGDKVRNEAQKMKGKAKEATGKATDDRSMQAEGMKDQGEAELKKQGEKAKDALK